MFCGFYQHRYLLYSLTKREITGRYKGSFLGMLWSLFNPLIMLVVYTFVFSVVFSARWGDRTESTVEYGLILFAGLIVFNLFSECFSRAPMLILENVNYVKKTFFPLEILQIVILGSACFHLLVSLAVWLFAHVILFGIPPVTIVWLPLILMPLCLFSLGISWLLASLGVYLRDVTHIVGICNSILLFMSAIFYPLSAMPENYHTWMRLNPLVLSVEMVRDVMYFGSPPNFTHLGLFWGYAVLAAWLGFAWFQLTRKGFADVL